MVRLFLVRLFIYLLYFNLGIYIVLYLLIRVPKMKAPRKRA